MHDANSPVANLSLPLTLSFPGADSDQKERLPRVPYVQRGPLGPPGQAPAARALPEPALPIGLTQSGSFIYATPLGAAGGIRHSPLGVTDQSEYEQLPLARAQSGQDLEALARGPETEESRRFTVDEFQYPADWETYQPAINIDIDQYTNLLNTVQCYDFLESSDIRFAEYLVEDPEDNIILIAPPPLNSPPNTLGNTAICTRRSELARTLTDLSAIALPCVGQGGTTFPPDASARFVRLALGNINIFVPENEVRSIVGGVRLGKIYQAEPTNLTIRATASADAILNLHYVSADHCQVKTEWAPGQWSPGSEKTIYHLRPVLSHELFGYSPEEFKEEESKRQLECKEDWTPGNYLAEYLGECGIGEQYNLGNVEAFQEPYGETLLNLSQPEFKRRNREIERNCVNEQGQFVPGDYPTRRMSQCLTPAHLQNLSEEEYNTLENRVRQSCIDTQMDYTRGNYNNQHQLGHCVATGEPYELGQVEALRTEEEQKLDQFLAGERQIDDSCNEKDAYYIPGIINERPGQCVGYGEFDTMSPEDFRNLNNQVQQTCITYGHGFVPGWSGPVTVPGACFDLLPGETVPAFDPANSVTNNAQDRHRVRGARNFTRGL